jgi:sodium-dependent phosphate cotransporter
MAADNNSTGWLKNLCIFILFLLFLYLFLLSIQLMGGAFKLFGKGFAEDLLGTTADPVTGLFIGLLATALTQSSSSTTSIVVGLVASGVLSIHNAIPIVMGANIGTTITNTIVSLGHISRKEEFRRAFSASVVHDTFNILSVAILFPLQYFTKFLEHISLFFDKLLVNIGSMSFASPLKLITSPVADSITRAVERITGDHKAVAVVVLFIALALLFLSLRYMVHYMKALIMERAEVIFERTIFKTPYHGFLFGLLLTTLVQSSSATVSLIVPIAGAGMIGLERVFPYTMGANVGTTVTALMAALATGNPSALAVAISHLMFNVCGISIFWWIRFVPIRIAEKLAGLTMRNRGYAVYYIILIFFVIPLTVIFLMR